jgi:hypothetical protein
LSGTILTNGTVRSLRQSAIAFSNKMDLGGLGDDTD